MSTVIHTKRKVIPFRRALMIGAIASVSTTLAAIYISIMTAQTIAPPGLRVLDFLWTVLSWLRG